jgi:zinc protease
LTFGVSTEVSWLGFDGYAVDTRRGLTTLREVIRARRHGKEGVLARRDAQLDAIDEQQLTDDSTLVEQLSMLAFGRSHPYAQSVGGSIGSLNAMTDEAVVARQRELVQPQGAVLVIVGDFDAEAVLKQAASTFEGWWNEFTPATRPIAAVMPSKRTTVHVISRLPARTTMLCATRALGDLKDADATIDVFAEVLRSRLATTLRERGGFTYHVEGFVVHHDHARALALCTRLAAATTSVAVKAFLSTIADARTPDEAEVARTRATLQTQRAIERRDAAGLSRSWAEAVARGKPPQLAEQQRALAEVTTEQVAAIGAKVLNRDQLQLLFSGDPTIIDAAVKAEGLGPSVRVMLGH